MPLPFAIPDMVIRRMFPQHGPSARLAPHSEPAPTPIAHSPLAPRAQDRMSPPSRWLGEKSWLPSKTPARGSPPSSKEKALPTFQYLRSPDRSKSARFFPRASFAREDRQCAVQSALQSQDISRQIDPLPEKAPYRLRLGKS